MIATKRFQAVFLLAGREARALGHDYIGTEHLLLGLLADDGCVGHGVLRGLGVDPACVRREVLAIAHAGPAVPPGGVLPQTPRARKCVELAAAEAARAGRNVGTGELLLGLLLENEGVAAQVLTGLGLSAAFEGVRRAVDDGTGAVDEGVGEVLRLAEAPAPRVWEAPADAAQRPPSSMAAAVRNGLAALALSLCLAMVVTSAIWPSIGPPALIAGGVLGAVGMLAGALGAWTAYREQARLAGMASPGQPLNLAYRRRELEAALVAKFGQLDDARREAIRGYDQDRIADAARRLAGAARIEDLDGDTQ